MKKIGYETGGEVTVRVRALAVGGAGVGDVVASNADEALIGIRAFVPFTSPGDVVTAKITERKERFIEAKLLWVLEGSPERTSPECEYFGRCGGCDLQHMQYESQLKHKREMVEGALKAGRLPEDVWTRVDPVVPGPPYGYRRRVTLHVDRQGKVGFYERGSRTVVSISHCPISVPGINEVLAILSTLTAPRIPGTLHLEAGASAVAAVYKVPEMLTKQQILELEGFLKQLASHGRVMMKGKEGASYGSQTLTLPMLGEEISVPAGSFSQVNWEVNQKLVEYVRGIVEKGGDSVHDLYAGAGNFGLTFARMGKRILAVELDRSLASTGEEQASQLRLKDNVSFKAMSVEQFLSTKGEDCMADIIVADPPRSGLGEVAKLLNYSGRLVLITCHLPSGVRDIRNLVEQGWKVESIRPFDMFSQTSYLETVTYLTRNS